MIWDHFSWTEKFFSNAKCDNFFAFSVVSGASFKKVQSLKAAFHKYAVFEVQITFFPPDIFFH